MSNATATAAAHFVRNEDGVEFCSCGFISKFFGDAARHAAKNNEAAPIIDAAVRAVADSRGTVNRRAVAAAALRMNQPASMIAKSLDCPRAGDGLAEHEGRVALTAALKAAIALDGGREALAAALDWYEADRKRTSADVEEDADPAAYGACPVMLNGRHAIEWMIRPGHSHNGEQVSGDERRGFCWNCDERFVEAAPAPKRPKREKVVIRAQSALRGQAVKLDAEALAILTAKADRDRAEFGETDLQPVSVEIRDRDDALVGRMTYRL